MRTFNPEKELNKIQKGNKNKIIIGVCLLLLIVAIGSSYALYQIKYNKRIIYTTVDKFYSKDIILSVKLDDQEKSTNKFPTKEEGYVYSHIECENGNITNINWNDDSWKLNADINGPDKCTVFFVKSPFHMKSCEGKEMSECLLEEGEKFTNILAFDDPDQNGRYIGANPANYIWFNCEDYSNPTEKTCERWRIIGSFKDIEKINGDGTTTKQNLIKIMNATPVTNGLPFDNYNKENGAATDRGISDWANSTLMKTLNPGYELNTNYNSNELTSNSLYWNRQEGLCAKGACPNGSNGETQKCSFTDEGIRETTKQYIENIRWDIGSALMGTAESFYNSERSDNKTELMKSSVWDGRVGLIYPSDFGYAVGGNVRNECLTKTLNTNIAECGENNWLFTKRYTATMIAFMNTTDQILFLHYKNPTVISDSYTNCAYSIEPVVYLTHDTKITSGDGTYDNPYVLAP